MPEFTNSYIALMREKRLKRELAEGDWFGWQAGPMDWFKASLCTAAGGPAFTPTWWLPLEGDWLEMLEERGTLGVCVEWKHEWPSKFWGSGGAWGAWRTAVPMVDSLGVAPTRVEALARLYFAVNKEKGPTPEGAGPATEGERV